MRERWALVIVASLGAPACSILDDAEAYAVALPDGSAALDGGSLAADGGEWTCDGPACPVVLATGVSNALFVSLVINGTRAYWSDGDSIWSCPKARCDQPTLLVAGQREDGGTGITSVAVDGARVFWTKAWAPDAAAPLLSCPVSGCSALPPSAIPAAPLASLGASDGEHVFWSDAEGVKSCPVTGCDAGVLLAKGTPYALGEVAMDDASLYWTSSSYFSEGSLGGTALTCAKTGCGLDPTVIASQLIGKPDVLVDGAGISWLTGDSIMACPRAMFGIGGDGCGDSITLRGGPVPSAGEDVQRLATDGTNLYWTAHEWGVSQNWGKIAKCVAGVCDTLAEGSFWPTLLAVDATSVYWTDDFLPPRIMRRTR